MIHDIIYQLPLQDLKLKGNRYHARCNICGDSAKSKKKKRAWIFEYNGQWFYKCYNCGNSFHLFQYLKIYFPEIYQSVLKRELKNDNPKIQDQKIIQEDIKLYTKFPLKSLNLLDKNHKAHQYIQNRKIPSESFNRLFYTEDFTKFVNQITNNKYKDWDFHDDRVVIPYYNRNKEIFAFQGRSLEEDHFLRYCTIKLDKNADKIYGLDRVDYSKSIYVLEGVFDSFFVDNSICMGGSDLNVETLNKYFSKDQVVFIFDLERRNKEINEKIENWLKLGYKIVLWPKYLEKYGKDINKFIEKGLTKKEIQNIIERNIVYGKEGILKFNIWRIR